MSKTRMLIFASTIGIDSRIWTEMRMSLYYDAGLLREPIDLFRLADAPHTSLAEVERQLSPASIPPEELIASVRDCLPISLVTFLQSLGVPEVRSQEVCAMAERVGTFAGLLAIDEHDAWDIPAGVEAERWRRLVHFIATDRHKRKLRDLGEQVPVQAISQHPPSAPGIEKRPRMLVVGAGLCGSYLARHLIDAAPGYSIRVLDEGDEPGGRMLSHRIDELPFALDFGAARFHQSRHPRLARLVEGYGIPVAPVAHARVEEIPDNAAPPRVLLQRALESSDQTRWSTTPMIDLCHERLTAREIRRLVTLQGYDVLLNPRLPASEGVRILDDHPETNQLENAGWLRVPPGFQEIVKRLSADVIRRGASFRFRSRVVSVERLPAGRLRVLCEDGHAEEADRVVLTLPAQALESLNLPLDAVRRQAIRSVEAVPLMKAFFVFKESWWRELGIKDDTCLVTDSPLRKVYFRPGHLAVYNDSATARYWEPLCDPRAVSSGLLWDAVRDALAILLPSWRVNIPEPTGHFAKYWPAGVYFWKLSVDPELAQQSLLAPDDTLHICSEAFSRQSGWGEAALASADLLLELLSSRGRLDGCRFPPAAA